MEKSTAFIWFIGLDTRKSALGGLVCLYWHPHRTSIPKQKSPLLKNSGLSLADGGERGIRTLGGVLPPHSLSRRAPSAYSVISPSFLAEGVGFEPTVLSYNGFQDRRLKPLGHPSRTCSCTTSFTTCQYNENRKFPSCNSRFCNILSK